MGKHGIDDLVYSEAREVVYEQVKWTATEKSFRSGIDRGVVLEGLTFSRCLADTIAKSSFGAILHVPVEDRESALEIARGSNPFTDDAECLLAAAKNFDGELDLPRVCGLLTTLRLIDCGITEVDCACVENLKTLNLSGNRIATVRGECLPKRLTFLELYGNEIADVRSLCTAVPMGLLHLGLARNRLKDNSGLEYLGSKRMFSVRSLDLGDNDIEDLTRLLRNLTRRLLNLRLEGNPCSMCYSYVNAVSIYSPTICHLDEMRMVDPTEPEFVNTKSGCLTFQCSHLTGVEEPSKEVWGSRTVVHEYRTEVDAPLFDPVRRLNVLLRVTEEETRQDETLLFPSDSVPWSAAMDFPVVRVRVPYFAGLTELRDIFRSVVTVRIVHTKSLSTVEIISEETVAEFEVELESLPWWVTSLNYEWEDGIGAKLLPKSGEAQATVRDTPGGLRCYVHFGVERS